MSSPAGENPFSPLAPYRRGVVAGILCLLVTNVLAQAIPWVVKWTVEAITGAAQGADTVSRLCTLVLALTVVQAGVRILSRVMIFNAGRDAEYDLRRSLFTRLCQLDSAFYRSFRTGDLMSRLTNDLGSVRALYGPGVLHVVNTVFAYAVALPLMLRIDPRLTLWSLLPYLALLVGARAFARGIYARSKSVQVSLAAMTTTVQENIAGIRELKNYGLEAERGELFERSSEQYLDESMRLVRWRSALVPFVGVGAGASLVVALWAGGAEVIAGRLTLGDLVAFNLYLGLLAWPTMAIGWMLSLWHRGVAAWHRLQEILQQRSALEVALGDDQDEAAAPQGAPPALEARGLTVRLGDAEVLRDVSFTVAPGTVCAIVGRVGSGKTVLAEALARLVVVPDGSLLVDGQDVNALAVDRVRSLVAYAPQTAFLFSVSIDDNIALGLEPGLARESEQARQRVEAAVRAAGLTPDLASFPDGLKTMVGERGLSLSGGQRQRVALARALVTRRPVLILDDSLSSVDASTEERILSQLRQVLSGRTALLISHRLSALQTADQVIVLDRGRLVETGRHDDLLEAGGVYAELYRRQLISELA